MEDKGGGNQDNNDYGYVQDVSLFVTTGHCLNGHVSHGKGAGMPCALCRSECSYFISVNRVLVLFVALFFTATVKPVR